MSLTTFVFTAMLWAAAEPVSEIAKPSKSISRLIIYAIKLYLTK